LVKSEASDDDGRLLGLRRGAAVEGGRGGAATQTRYPEHSIAGRYREASRVRRSVRRAWATELKHLPDADVRAAGGWRDPRSVKGSYSRS